jgi:hypothetical protein
MNAHPTHEFGPWLADCDIEGAKEKRCKRCSAKRWSDEVIPDYGNPASERVCGEPERRR